MWEYSPRKLLKTQREFKHLRHDRFSGKLPVSTLENGSWPRAGDWSHPSPGRKPLWQSALRVPPFCTRYPDTFSVHATRLPLSIVVLLPHSHGH